MQLLNLSIICMEIPRKKTKKNSKECTLKRKIKSTQNLIFSATAKLNPLEIFSDQGIHENDRGILTQVKFHHSGFQF